MDKHIEVADRHHVIATKKGHLQKKMCNDNRNLFIATLHSVVLAQDKWDRFFSIITFMNSGHSCLFHKGLFTV